MPETFLYHKIYETGPVGLVLQNMAPAMEYIENKIRVLFEARNEELVDEKVGILSDFKKIYDFDLQDADLPNPSGAFKDAHDIDEFKRKHFLVDDFSLYLGNICCNYHMRLFREDSQRIPLLEATQVFTDYGKPYAIALNDYLRAVLDEYPDTLDAIQIIKKEEGQTGPRNTNYQSAYAAAYIIPALIEHFLLNDLMHDMFYKCLDNLKMLVDSGSETISSDEAPLYKEFVRGRNDYAQTFFASKEMVMGEAYEMFVRHGILSDQDDNRLILTGKGKSKNKKQATIGSILHSPFAKQEIRLEYYEIIDMLFSTDKMNIRNGIMHGSDSLYNYCNVLIVGPMMQLMWDVADRSVFTSYRGR